MPASERRPVSIARMAQPKSLGRLKDLAEACAQCAPPVSSRSLALALRAALATDARWQRWQELELVWTGPAPMDSALRRTDQAILDVISGSRRELLMVTFAAYKIRKWLGRSWKPRTAAYASVWSWNRPRWIR